MADVPLQHPVNAVLSYAYFGTADLADLAAVGLRIVADSGAFSMLTKGRAVDPAAYYEWLRTWQPHLAWAASLDVIGDAEASWENWRTAPDDLALVPTVHYGEGTATLDRYAAAGATLVGLGGMVARRGEQDRLLRWTATLFQHAHRHWPGLRFHGWGVSHPRLLDTMPWWSTDTSGIGSGYRYGRIKVWDDRTRAYRTVATDGRASAADRDLIRSYGITWRDVLTSTADSRRPLMRLGVASLQRQQSWLARRWQVTPPAAYAQRLPPHGPILHAVDGRVRHWYLLGKDLP